MTDILASMIHQITSSVEKEKKTEKRGQKASPSIAKLRNQIEEKYR